MESRNIEKALEISAKLAAGETVSEQGTNAALYQEYSTNPEVYDMVLLSLKKMELSVYEYNNSLFAAPKAHGSLFGYSNEALRRELGLRTNGELYLAYFIIYNIIMEFYTDTISATYAEFVRVEDIVRKVDDTTAGIVDKKNGFVLSEIEEAFSDTSVEIVNIGDSKRARRIIEGTEEGRNILNVLARHDYL